MPRPEREAARQVEQVRTYGEAEGRAPEQTQRDIEQDLVDLGANEGTWARQLGTMLGDFVDPAMLAGGVAGERLAMGVIQTAARRGVPSAVRIARLAQTPAGAPLVRRLVARTVHGLATGGAANVGFLTAGAVEEGRVPDPLELGVAFGVGTALTPALEAGGALAAAPFRAGRGAPRSAVRLPDGAEVHADPGELARQRTGAASAEATGTPEQPVRPGLRQRLADLIDPERSQQIQQLEGERPAVAPAPSTIVRFPTEQITADPARFQFKSLGTEGVSGELKGVTRFNEQLAGVVSVWRDPADGQVYVVNGHHRVDLARRTGQRELNVQFIEAPTAEAARAEGAYMNIAEGRGTATDVAKFLRDLQATPVDLEARGVSVRGDLARDGLALSKLAPDVFDQVATAQVPQGWGVAIGSMLDDPVLQREVLTAARRSGRRLSQSEVVEVARQVRDAGTEALTQETLFGTETERHGLFVQRAQLATAIKKRLAGDKRLFGYVAREGRAEELSRAGGTQIDVEAARGIAEGSARAEEVFDRLYTRSGPLADLVSEGARRIARGEKSSTVLADIYPAIGESVSAEVTRAGGGAQPHVGEHPVPEVPRSLADEVAGAEAGRVVDSQDPEQGGMFSPVRRAGRSYNAHDLRSSIEAAVESAQRTGREMYLYPTARGWRVIDQRPPTSGTHYHIDPRGRVVQREAILEGEGGWREREVSTGDVPASSRGRELQPGEDSPEPLADVDPNNLGVLREARRRSEFEVTAEQLVEMSRNKGIGVEQAAENLRRFSYVVPDEIVAQAKRLTIEDADLLASGIAKHGEPMETMVRRSVERGEIDDVTAQRLGMSAAEAERFNAIARDVKAAERPALEMRAEAEGPEQGSMFGERAGTTASRSLAQTEASARGELEELRQRFAGEKDSTRRATIARQIADREKLVNRTRGIGEQELRAQAAAQGREPAPTGPDQLALLSPDLPPSYLGKLKQMGADVPTVAEQAEVKTLMEISRQLAEAVSLPLNQGRFRAALRRAAGVFHPFSETGRVTRFDKLAPVAHEIGHFISKKYLRNPTMRSDRFRGAGRQPVLLPREATRELVQMGRDLYGGRKPAGGYGEEGIAEWISFYVTEPHTLADKAPTFTAYMDGVLAQEPLLKAALDRARADFATYQKAPAAARFDAQISVGERQRFAVTIRDYMRVVADDTYDVRAAVQDLGTPRPASEDAGILARLTRGAFGEAHEWLERGVLKSGTADERVTAGIVETFGPLVRAGRAQELRRYLDAESALERWEQGHEQALTREDSRAMVDLYAKDPKIRAAAEAAWAHSLALLEARRAAGLITDAQFKQIAGKNRRRVGFYRIFEPDETAGGKGGARGGLGSSGIKGQTGSARRQIDPIEAIIRDTYDTVKKVRAHEAKRALVEHALATEGGGRIVEEVPAPMRPVTIPVQRVLDQLADLGLVYEGVDVKGQRFTAPLDRASGAEIAGILHAFQEARVAGAAEAKDLVFPMLLQGELRWFKVRDRPLYDALVGLGPQELTLWRRVLSAPKRLLQTGATSTLEFGFGNIARDIVAQSVFSRAPWRPPLWRHLEGVYHILRRDPVYQRFRLHRAEQATMGGTDRGTLQVSTRRLFGYFRTLEQAWLDRRMAWSRATPVEKGLYVLSDVEAVVLSPFEALRTVKELSETMGRVGEFAALERQALKRGARPVDAATEAALGARDVGLDFQQLGSATREVNNIVAFFGAWLRGWAQLGRELKARPHIVIPRLVAEVTVPSLALYYLQRDDPVYRDMPWWKRDIFWVYVQRGEDRGEGWDGYGSGKVEHIWMFPKPFELGFLFGTLPEIAAEAWDERNPDTARRTTEMLKRMTPPYIPTAINPLIENYANRSTFRDRPIVPRSREGLVPAEQVRPQTGETARLVGQALDYSPAKIENLVRGYTGGAGGYVLSGTDAAMRAAREAQGLPPLRPADSPEEDPLVDVPGLRRFVSRIPAEDAESVERLYQRFERAERHRRTWRAMLREGRRAEAAAYLEGHRQEIVSVVTTEETQGAPGPLRAAYQQMQELQQLRRDVGRQLTSDDRRRVADAMRRVGAAATVGP